MNTMIAHTTFIPINANMPTKCILLSNLCGPTTTQMYVVDRVIRYAWKVLCAVRAK